MSSRSSTESFKVQSDMANLLHRCRITRPVPALGRRPVAIVSVRRPSLQYDWHRRRGRKVTHRAALLRAAGSLARARAFLLATSPDWRARLMLPTGKLSGVEFPV